MGPVGLWLPGDPFGEQQDHVTRFGDRDGLGDTKNVMIEVGRVHGEVDLAGGRPCPCGVAMAGGMGKGCGCVEAPVGWAAAASGMMKSDRVSRRADAGTGVLRKRRGP